MDCRSLGLLLINRNRESLTLKLENFIHSILKYARPDPDSVKIWFADFAVGPSGLNLGSGKLDWNDLVSENVLVWNDLVSENVLVSYSVFMSCVGKLVCVCELCFCQLGKSAQTFQRDFPN